MCSKRSYKLVATGKWHLGRWPELQLMGLRLDHLEIHRVLAQIQAGELFTPDN